MDKVKRLQEEIASKMAELEKLKKEEANSQRNKAVRSLAEFSDAEKIAKFDELYKSANGFLKKTEETGYEDDDNEHYAYEMLMEILARDKEQFWDYWRKLG